MKKYLIVILIGTCLLTACNKSGEGKESKSEIESKEDFTGLSIEERFDKIDRIKSYKEIENYTTSLYQKVYEIQFEQDVDHTDKSKGTFLQQLQFGFVDFSAHNVLVSEGYFLDWNYSYPYMDSQSELSFLLEANFLAMEHRYFGTSLPVQIDYYNIDSWSYLTTKQAADDAHEVVKEFKRILDGKWISEGASKGGMTTELFCLYHPGDVDVYVPYVAPFCNGFYDKRAYKFIYEEAGDRQYGKEQAAKYRSEVLEFQIKMLEYRDEFAPKYFNSAKSENVKLSTYATADNIYDAAILEFAYGLWQYYQSFDKMEDILKLSDSNSNKKNRLYNYFTSIINISDLAVDDEFAPYYVQAYQELGNYGYDYSYIREAIKGNSKAYISVDENEEQYLAKHLLLNEELYKLPEKELCYTAINNMLKTTNEKFIIIYGSSDPWYSVRPDDVTGRDNISIYVNTSAPHSACISNINARVAEEIITKINQYLS